jgi:hypothetical protein
MRICIVTGKGLLIIKKTCGVVTEFGGQYTKELHERFTNGKAMVNMVEHENGKDKGEEEDEDEDKYINVILGEDAEIEDRGWIEDPIHPTECGNISLLATLRVAAREELERKKLGNRFQHEPVQNRTPGVAQGHRVLR